MAQDKTKIAIIGVGASGAITFINLIKSILKKGTKVNTVELYLIEEDPILGNGLAYRTNKEYHITNMRAGTMSIYSDKPSDFIAWLEKNYERFENKDLKEVNSQNYFPRYMFGKYIQECLEVYIKKAKENGLQVHIVRDEVTNCKEQDTKIAIQTKSSQMVVDYAIITIGNLPSTDYQEFIGLPNYYHSPWGFDVNQIDKNQSIGIVGSSLTAIDGVLSIYHSDHKGTTYCISRSGFFPKVQGEKYLYKPKFITMQNLKRKTNDFSHTLKLTEIIELFRKELEYALQEKINWKKTLTINSDMKNVLGQDIKNAKDNHTKWYSVLDSTAQIVPFIWRNMAVEDKRIFIKKYIALWRTFRHSIPLENAEKIFNMIDAERLKPVSELQKISYDKERRMFIVDYLEDTYKKSIKVGYLINALGTGFKVQKMKVALIENMLKSGTLDAHPFGGVNINFETSNIIKHDGNESKNIFFIGPLTRGVHFYTSAIEMICPQTVNVVKRIVDEMVT